MNRTWLGVRLRAARLLDHDDRFLDELVRTLVDQLRTADPGARWQFDRRSGRDEAGADVWFYSTVDVTESLERAATWLWASGDRTVSVARGRPAAPAGAQFAELRHALAEVSSQFALEAIPWRRDDGGLEFALAAAHLRLVAELVAPGDRASFLFVGWHQWSRDVTPRRRVEIGAGADLAAAEVIALTERLVTRPSMGEIWSRYAADLHAVVARLREQGCDVLNFLLFEQAQRTHQRMGLAPEVESAAAWAVRRALLADPATAELSTVVLMGPPVGPVPAEPARTEPARTEAIAVQPVAARPVVAGTVAA